MSKRMLIFIAVVVVIWYLVKQRTTMFTAATGTTVPVSAAQLTADIPVVW